MSQACGIQDWNSVKPGDPDGSLTLVAIAGYGGILIRWTLPVHNPHSVAFVKLFKSRDIFENTEELSVSSGDRFFDSEAIAGVTYHYWAQTVSINGTIGSLVGPVSAIAMDTIGKLMADLSGKIDASVLGQALQDDITKIGILGHDLIEEARLRKLEYQSISGALNQAQQAAQAAFTYINSEISQRKTAVEALVTGIDIKIASFGDNVAALANTLELRVGPTSAIAQSIETLTTKVGDKTVTGSTGLFQSIDSVTNKVVNMWSARVTTDLGGKKLIGGFGLSNDGVTIDAHFDVNNFSVGKAGMAVKPFIIQNDKVMINELIAKKVTFDTIEDTTGNFVVKNGKLSAQYIDANSIVINGSGVGGRMQINKDAITVYDATGRVRVQIGKLG